MASTILQPTTYKAYQPPTHVTSDVTSPLDRRTTLNTIIEDDPQDDFRFSNRQPSMLQRKVTMTIGTGGTLAAGMFSPNARSYFSPTYTEDFPTPRASEQNTMRHSMDDQNTPRRSTHLDYFDELYDITDDESEEDMEMEVPLHCSNSVKKTSISSLGTTSARSSRSRYPSLIIPSPSAWPTIEKLKSAVTPLSPQQFSAQLSPGPNVLSKILARSLMVPGSSATPSLDGSLTSEEMSNMSCPATPDMHNAATEDDAWDAPVQLAPEAFETLQVLTEVEFREPETQIIELPELEMQQVDREASSNSEIDVPSTPVDSNGDPLSALSIPSPGGFFSTLNASARHTWRLLPTESVQPTTSVAESFYGVPWVHDTDVPEVPKIPSRYLPPQQIGESTEAVTPASTTCHGWPGEDEEVIQIKPSEDLNEFDEQYEGELQKTADANRTRTSTWLSAQHQYLSGLLEQDAISLITTSSNDSGRKRSDSAGTTATTTSPSKKSVRFIDDIIGSPTNESDAGVSRESIFLEGFQYVHSTAKRRDAYIHRQMRAEAIDVVRRCMPEQHRAQLLGNFQLKLPERPSPSRPVSHFYASEDPSVQKEMLAQVQKERQALELILPSTWVLDAAKKLNGGHLLSAPAHEMVRQQPKATILDIGGQAACEWAWRVALECPRASVRTVATVDQVFSSDLEAPANHRTTVVPNLWTLPYPSGHFDVISARSLYALLKTERPAGKTQDEYELCLRECYRCLKPGGFLEFSVQDADILKAGDRGYAMSVEFGFNLKTRGYDANPTKTFLARVKKAGFEDVKRAWMILPMAAPTPKWSESLDVQADKGKRRDSGLGLGLPHSSANASNFTGLIGSWNWEKWLLKLQMEMGKDEGHLLEGVSAVLEEGSRTEAGWRYLTGWARKPL